MAKRFGKLASQGRRQVGRQTDMESPDAWGGLEAASQAFGRVGLAPLTLRRHCQIKQRCRPLAARSFLSPAQLPYLLGLLISTEK